MRGSEKMDDRSISVLLVEDNAGDARLFRELLAEVAFPRYAITQVGRLDRALHLLEEAHFDLIMLDLWLPDEQGFATFARVHGRAEQTPTIVLTGLEDEILGLKTVRGGAQDYLIKGQFDGNLLARSMRYAIERKQTEEALRQSEERWRTYINDASDLIFTLDPAGRIASANRALCKAVGYREEELLGHDVVQLIAPESYTAATEALAKILNQEDVEQIELEVIGKDGLRITLEIRGRTLYEQGRFAGTFHIARDVTERKRAEEALARQEADLQATLYGIGDAVVATDVGGHVVRMNPMAEQLTGWTEAEAAGQPISEIMRLIDEQTRRRVENPVARVLLARKMISLSSHTLTISKDGREIPIADSAAPIFDSGGIISGVGFLFHEQTEERMVQRVMEVRLSLIEYAASHTLAELLSWTLDEVGRFVDSPIGFYHFVEPDQQTLSLQQWSSRTLAEFCQTESDKLHYNIDQAGVWVDCVHDKKPVIHNDYASLPHKKGMPPGHAQVLREMVVPVMRDDMVVAILGVGNKATEYTQKDVEIVSYFADVTWEIVRQKRAEQALRESENRYRQLFEAESDAVFLIDNQTGRILEANSAAEAMYGYSRQELLARRNTDLSAEPEDTRRVTQTSPLILEQVVNIPFRLHRKSDGTVFPVEITGRFFLWQGRPVHVAAIRDITERKLADEQIRASLREKEVLLKEIHHRVKNNLQVVSSLLALQADSVSDPQVCQMFQDSRSRIRAMSLIHERLYRARDLASIDAAEYVHDLVAHLFSIYANPARVVHSHVRVDELVLGIDTAIPCGLLLTELVSNVLKHAYPPAWKREGRIHVELRVVKDGWLVLAVGDDGVGLPTDLDLNKPQSLGLQLVNLLARQLRGTVELDRSAGTTFHVTFPYVELQP
jgi:PAS domain S-box-containing protein